MVVVWHSFISRRVAYLAIRSGNCRIVGQDPLWQGELGRPIMPASLPACLAVSNPEKSQAKGARLRMPGKKASRTCFASHQISSPPQFGNAARIAKLASIAISGKTKTNKKGRNGLLRDAYRSIGIFRWQCGRHWGPMVLPGHSRIGTVNSGLEP